MRRVPLGQQGDSFVAVSGGLQQQQQQQQCRLFILKTDVTA